MDMGKDCLHSGHRKRMIERFLSAPQGFSEHEILEIALFYAVPRKNTNELAHRLITSFKDLKGVLSATPEQLKTVSGVGDSVAYHIHLLAKLVEASKNKFDVDVKNYNYFNFERTKRLIIERMQDYSKESFLMILLDKDYNELTAVLYDDDRPFRVNAELTQLVYAINAHKPDKILIAHNHAQGDCKPGKRDDVATLKIALLCDIHAVSLLDHVIIFEDSAYSYFQEMRLNYVKNSLKIEELFKDKENEQDGKS